MSFTLKTFSTRPGQRGPILAAKAWLILVSHAKAGRPVTYTQLADLVGMGQTANTITNNAVIYITAYCDLNGLPPLNAIVCSRDAGKPGEGTPDPVSMFRVFEFDWYDVCPPSPKALRAARKAYFNEPDDEDAD
jgi:hypothetical protein